MFELTDKKVLWENKGICCFVEATVWTVGGFPNSHEVITPGIPSSNWVSSTHLNSQILSSAGDFSDPQMILDFPYFNIFLS